MMGQGARKKELGELGRIASRDVDRILESAEHVWRSLLEIWKTGKRPECKYGEEITVSSQT